MGLFPKVPDLDQIEKVFDEDFDRLIAKIDEVVAEIKGLRADLGGPGAPPTSRSM